MALNVQINRIDANPVLVEQQSQPHLVYVTPENSTFLFPLMHVTETPQVRKFPVRIFDMQVEELQTSA